MPEFDIDDINENYSIIKPVLYNFDASYHYFFVLLFAILGFNLALKYGFIVRIEEREKNQSKFKTIVYYLFVQVFTIGQVSVATFMTFAFFYKQDLNFFIGFFLSTLTIRLMRDWFHYRKQKTEKITSL